MPSPWACMISLKGDPAFLKPLVEAFEWRFVPGIKQHYAEKSFAGGIREEVMFRIVAGQALRFQRTGVEITGKSVCRT